MNIECSGYLFLSIVAMTLTTLFRRACAVIHVARAAVTTVVLSCDLSIDVVDKNDCHNGKDNIYNDFLHSYPN